jgi:trans-aconitate methyltransferase
MKAYFLACPVCLSTSQEVLFQGFHKNVSANKTDIDYCQSIVLCQDCGAVFRNPVVPGLNEVHYQAPYHWGGADDLQRFAERLEFVAGVISQHVKLRTGDSIVDIGGGPGWLARKLTNLFPHARVVLCEPAIENTKFAKSQTANLIVVPSRLDEFITTPNTFSLVTATGVDYLFLDHRAAMLKISEMMRENGTLYIERNVFVEQEAYYRQPIFDHEDMFGINHMMNFWPGRQQFLEYLSTFFDILDHIEYNFGETFGYKCQMFGVFCKKRSKARRWTGKAVTNRYSSHLTALQQRAPLSSLADLSFLAKNGLRKVGICGDEKETNALRLLIEKNNLFEVAQLSLDPVLAGKDGFSAAERADLRQVDAIFVASVSSQDDYCERLRKRGYRGQLFPCFRKGLPFFDTQTSAGNLIQMKAFLPSLISGKRNRGVR